MNVRLLLLCLTLTPLCALADAVRVSLQPRAAVGKGLPELRVHIEEPIAGFELKLERGDGQQVRVKGGGKPGTTRALPLEQPEGRFHYEGELVVRFPDAEEASIPLSFDTELLGPLKLTVVPEDVDVPGRKLRFTLSRPAARAQVTVLMDTGKTAFDGEVPFDGAPAGQPLEVTWPEAEGKVLRISLKAFDTADFYTGMDFFPWRVDIPHEEINFASGKADVPAAERRKLDASHALIADAVTRYGRFAQLRLYILGHTDTVGDTDSNRKLSLERARSIAAYLRKRGLKLPIFYEGFGEQSPRVPTQDETDEAANRRAEYILAIEPPALASTPFPPQWRKL
ncbi:OmpA family protein [Archangium violaceum]|uniref:Cell envelope biogenesis protein OmpA n=1 Tax=Archangium violaceum Cb vi76 TaxID=1406225 RepID=A0A084SI55_9BACT|nr:OmpA family protein [Archangium violaceum]KFA88140.1 cell envelope biogenesis protein OmpA [Archangium violaceum Cb vi76]